MKKFVIYSAIIGAYDRIIQPAVVDDEFDYVLFSDCMEVKQIGVWSVQPINFSHPMQTKIARYIKTHPHTLLPEYEYSVWIDASIEIKSDYIYQRIKQLHAEHASIAALHHPDRDCIYDEMVAVVMYNFETEAMLFSWYTYLREQHFPEHNGLYETGIMYRANTDSVNRMNEDWWWCIDSYSRRDQLSFNYVLWKHHLPCAHVFPSNIDIRNSEHVALVRHTRAHNRDAYYDAPKPILLRIVDDFPQDDAVIRGAYLKAFHSKRPRMILASYIVRLYPQYAIYRTYKCIKRKIKKIICK